MKVTCGGKETILNVVKLYKMKVPPTRTLNISGSLHLIIGYLVKNK